MIDTLSAEGFDLLDTSDRRAVSRRRTEAARPRGHVVNEAIFRSVLLRERKRADRFDQPFLLMLVTVDGQVGGNATATWGGVIDGLAAVKRDTDVLGWFDGHSVIGLIAPEISGNCASAAEEFQARVGRELQTRLSPDARAHVSLRLHAHPAAKDAAVEAFVPVDQLLSSLQPREPQFSLRAGLKRALDIVGSLAALLVLSPVFLVIGALVKMLSPGPVFFRQTRIGQDGAPFKMLKFRSMYVNADSAVHQQYVTSFIKSGGQNAEGGKPGVFVKLANDTRITPIGNFIRKTSLDELPQFWNVLIGEMSLVGPRPPLAYEVDAYKAWHVRRVLEAKPGITGPWQVTGRSRTTFDEMVRLDLRYAKSYSLWTDIKILLATPRAVISGKGAC